MFVRCDNGTGEARPFVDLNEKFTIVTVILGTEKSCVVHRVAYSKSVVRLGTINRKWENEWFLRVTQEKSLAYVCCENSNVYRFMYFFTVFHVQESLIWIIQNSPTNGEEICSLLLGDKGCGEFQRSPWKVPLPPRRHPAPAHPHLDASPTAHYKRDIEVWLQIFYVLNDQWWSANEISPTPKFCTSHFKAYFDNTVLDPRCYDDINY